MYRGVHPRGPCDPVLFKDFSELWSGPLSTLRRVHSGVIEISLLVRATYALPKQGSLVFKSGTSPNSKLKSKGLGWSGRFLPSVSPAVKGASVLPASWFS